MDTGEYCNVNATSNQEYEDISQQKPVKLKNSRRRKREFHNSIQTQMEFYFGDANLSKDRYLMQLIKEDPFVPLEVFLKFNKIKKIVSSTEDIAKALSYSDFLELNEDKTKVRRITDIPTDRNADDRTIYVESLPPTADHDWVKNVFIRFGPIAYVSLPRFKISRKIKEFGFVEFEKSESIQKAINAFKTLGNVISVDSTDPEKLMSITSYHKEQNECETVDDIDNIVDNKEKSKKRLHSFSSANESNEESSSKRQKTSHEEGSGDESEESEGEETSSMKPNVDDTDDESVVQKKKKRRKRKKKSQKKSNTIEFDMNELRILSKSDWKRLRNKYLNMQRKKMGELKREFQKKRNRPIKSRENINNKVEVKKPQSMNFYGAGQDNEDTNVNTENSASKIIEHNPALDRKPLFKYEANLIVRIKLLEACVDVKSFKADMKQHSGVKYVDIKEGAIEAFIRCDTPKQAKHLQKKVSCAEYICEILSGDSEIEYWNKIMKDRETKLNKQIKIPQKRGREKFANAIATHILFNDEV